MPIPAEISQLVELFERNYDQYRDPAFTEAAVRTSSSTPCSSRSAGTSTTHRALRCNHRTPYEKAALQRRIEVTDRQIDALVYGLYELTPEEIKVVEGSEARL